MEKIAVLYDAGQTVLSTFDLDEVWQRILAIARDYFHLQIVPKAAFFLLSTRISINQNSYECPDWVPQPSPAKRA
jgi:hypothetical protein